MNTKPSSKPKTKPSASGSKKKEDNLGNADARMASVNARMASGPNAAYMRQQGINVMNAAKREGHSNPVKTALEGGTMRNEKGEALNRPSRVNKARLATMMEDTAHGIERDRIKKNFGEDIGPRTPAAKPVVRKPRNRAEAARKAAITRKMNGK